MIVCTNFFVGPKKACQEGDHGSAPPKNTMEELHGFTRDKRWICIGNVCIDSCAIKWLLHQHLDKTHGFHMEVGKFGHPLFIFGGERKKDHESMIFCSLNNPQEKLTNFLKAN
jgi:hypothetical protein